MYEFTVSHYVAPSDCHAAFQNARPIPYACLFLINPRRRCNDRSVQPIPSPLICKSKCHPDPPELPILFQSLP